MNKKTTIGIVGAATVAATLGAWQLLRTPPPSPVIPVVGHQAFAGDMLALPDGNTYTVPPSVRIIFQRDVNDPWSTCRVTWEEAVQAQPRDAPNQCRVRVGAILWYYARCFRMRPLTDSPAERELKRLGYTELPEAGSPDCREEREAARDEAQRSEH